MIYTAPCEVTSCSGNDQINIRRESVRGDSNTATNEYGADLPNLLFITVRRTVTDLPMLLERANQDWMISTTDASDLTAEQLSNLKDLGQ